MKGHPDERAITLANYIINNKETVRKTAQVFNISKSTVHKDVTERLFNLNFELYCKVKEVLNINKLERHIRGGTATKNKYNDIKKNKYDEK
ncbi:MAG: sporulation transcriptional regulator SpoIIID [Oscillospiraceae bacterium]